MGMLTHRRYRARLAARALTDGKTAVASVHKAAAEAQDAGTPLPTDFPARDLLATAEPVAILSYEDLYGTSERELTSIPGIGPRTAGRILAALDAWNAE
jgi:hypothetical protein